MNSAIGAFLPRFHLLRKDLKFFFPWVVHQELDTMKSKRRVPGDGFDSNSIHSAIGMLDMLINLQAEHRHLAYIFQTANDAATCAASNLPHSVNDDDIMLSALYLSHKNQDLAVLIWSNDRVLLNKVRVSGLSAITERDGRLNYLPPLSSTESMPNRMKPGEIPESLRNSIITPPQESMDSMMVDSPDKDLNWNNVVAHRMPSQNVASGYGQMPRHFEPQDCSLDSIIPKHLQRQNLNQPMFDDRNMMDANSGMFWQFDQHRSQSAMGHHQQMGNQNFRRPSYPPQQQMPNRPGSSSFEQQQYHDDPLSKFLVAVVVGEMDSAYNSDPSIWTNICVLRRQPRSWREAIVCVDRHWIAVFKMVFGTAKTVTSARETIHRLAKSDHPNKDELNTAGRVLANSIVNNPLHGTCARLFLRQVPVTAIQRDKYNQLRN